MFTAIPPRRQVLTNGDRWVGTVCGRQEPLHVEVLPTASPADELRHLPDVLHKPCGIHLCLEGVVIAPFGPKGMPQYDLRHHGYCSSTASNPRRSSSVPSTGMKYLKPLTWTEPVMRAYY